MVYGYRRPPYRTRGVISDDGLTWDIKDEFVIREGGVPGKVFEDRPSSSLGSGAGLFKVVGISTIIIRGFSTYFLSSSCSNSDGTVVACYHEWSNETNPIQFLQATRFKVNDK